MNHDPLPVSVLLIGLPILMVFWVAMWFLLAWSDQRRLRRAKARGERSAPHWNELAIVLWIISTLVLLLIYILSWIRPIGQ